MTDRDFEEQMHCLQCYHEYMQFEQDVKRRNSEEDWQHMKEVVFPAIRLKFSEKNLSKTMKIVGT